MPKLNDTQLMLLAHAAKRDSGSLYPLPDTLAATTRATKAVSALVTLAMVEERQVTDLAEISRTEDDQGFGMFITPTGLTAIGIVEAGEGGVDELSPEEAVMSAAKRSSKAADVLMLLGREQGATMPELIEATGWLPHTTRAALTGLRKKGHEITRGKRDEATCYTIAAAAAA